MMKINYFLLTFAAMALLTGCAPTMTVMGRSPGPTSVPVTAVRDLKTASTNTVIAGKMIEKCPVAGCWFMLRDKTGVIKVDLKTAGFVVTNVPVGAQIQAVGRLKTVGERRFEATGIRVQ